LLAWCADLRFAAVTRAAAAKSILYLWLLADFSIILRKTSQ